jgi:HSP20 family protein
MTNLAHYNPFDDVLGDFAKGFMVKPFMFEGQPDLQIKVDIKEDEKAYTVRADIPGVKKEDIKVTVDGNQVDIRAEVKKESEKKDGKVLRSERYEGMVARSFQLPCEVDMAGTQAKYQEGSAVEYSVAGPGQAAGSVAALRRLARAPCRSTMPT